MIGYPPEDLLLRPALHQKLNWAYNSLLAMSYGLVLCVGLPTVVSVAKSDLRIDNETADPPRLHNSVALFSNGELLTVYNKQSLPNYQVFDERRYFAPGNVPCEIDIRGYKVDRFWIFYGYIYP